MKFKVGDKVVPISKEAYGNLERSVAWNNCKDIRQPYMYVKEVSCDIIVCSTTEHGTGDYFLEKDLVLYKEDNNKMPVLEAGMVVKVDGNYLPSDNFLLINPNYGISLTDTERYTSIYSYTVENLITEIYKVVEPFGGFTFLEDNLILIWEKNKNQKIINTKKEEIKKLQKEIEELENDTNR